ncbi:MAG: DUF3748 domain-containing protein [Candidatus Marinimicrobia bacterium]|nr:DUF3748 domain-containing protein [Candidatus Neomarinimicrobiota bacterium]
MSKFKLILITILISLWGCTTKNVWLKENQLTFGSYNHSLDNNDNFSPDGQWLVYDTRKEDGGIRMGQTIERVHISSGKIDTVYTAPNMSEYGPGLGAVSYNPTKDQVIFIHGLLDPTKEEPYTFTRRFGAIVNIGEPHNMIVLDARDVTFPFTKGALRGGTHRHEFSGDGKWVGYTYNDAIMALNYPEKNLRTIGVSRIGNTVNVNSIDRKHFSGISETVVAVKVTQNPEYGSDEISHAADDSWVGKSGYIDKNGNLQRARAFLGEVRSQSNQKVKELFIVDMPEDLDLSNESMEVAETLSGLPTPPKSFNQRRLTWTAETQFPGCSGIVRSSPDGNKMAYLSRDKHGVQQVFLMSPIGGKPTQLTSFDSSVQSGVRWNSNGTHICFVWNNAIVIANVNDGSWKQIIQPIQEEISALVWNSDDSTIAYNKNVYDENAGKSFAQIFTINVNTEGIK